ncbi:DUF305 domain-containing protein [Streptomyces sp. XM4193]|uniref:DUF305 domain-containing protein n=1 Tax=Streptomyces sp. XM4193 TaxID=2929782 RepID=UPI001FF9368F|nr:DUF305 domain-containing protein [Streptomyces sp. XM4193]MCK1797746.1 DUF305 domain-containing protein [Streptomyces sp. XM4193]
MRRHPTRRTARTVCALLALALLTGAAGCSGSESNESAGPDVIAPGRPGEEATTVSPDEAKAAHRRQNRPNRADFEFHTMMIVHHQQALEMSELADKHAKDDRVGKLADRIRTAQGPEITFMRAWLKRNSANDPSDSAKGHDHSSMPGMASAEQLRELREARGKEFDELFLTLMSTHHEGAVTMALDALREGNDITTSELATEIAAQQKAEIGRMRSLR